MKRVMIPIDKLTFREIPCANTLQGEAPVKDTIKSPSPKPNKVKPKHKKRNVEIFGLKFNGLSELHQTFGTFLILRNILLNTLSI